MPSASTALLQRLEWRARHAVTTIVSGDYRSAFRGRGMEFDQVVKYQWGDDPRDIDWNVTARLGEPYRKRFIEERDLSVIFVFEDSPALQFGSEGRTRRETLLEATALLMLISSINKDRVGLLYASPGKSWFQRALPGRRDGLRVAATLLAQQPPPLDGPSVCAVQWRTMRKIASRGSVLIWLGPFVPSAIPAGWRELQQRFQTVGIRADDPWDSELPENAQFAAYDPLAGRLTTIDTSAPAQRAAHRRWRGEREAHFAHLFPRLDDRLKIRNVEDPLHAIVAYFHRHRHSGRAA
jgi:uncharacterized protein (DUF58 family)